MLIKNWNKKKKLRKVLYSIKWSFNQRGEKSHTAKLFTDWMCPNIFQNKIGQIICMNIYRNYDEYCYVKIVNAVWL